MLKLRSNFMTSSLNLYNALINLKNATSLNDVSLYEGMSCSEFQSSTSSYTKDLNLIFNNLDSNGDKKLQSDEISKYKKSGSKGNITLSKVISSLTKQIEAIKNANSEEKTSAGNSNSTESTTTNSDTFTSSASTATTTTESSDSAQSLGGKTLVTGGSNPITYADVDDSDSVEDLTQQKNEINSKTDTEISEKRNKLNEEVQKNTNIDNELKAKHSTLTQSITATEMEISKLTSEISTCDSQINTADCSIAKINAELSSLKTNDDSKYDNANSNDTKVKQNIAESRAARRAELQQQLEAAEADKAAAEAKKIAATEQKTNATTKLNTDKVSLTTLQAEMSKQAPELAAKTSQFESEIAAADSTRKSTVSAIDKKIADLKPKELSASKFKGKKDGETTEIGKRVLEIATDPESMAAGGFVNQRDWCVKYASYCYNKALEEFGADTKMPQYSKDVKAYAAKMGGMTNVKNMNDSEQTVFNQTELKPGDLFVNKNHVGIILEVYEDGSYRTIEGNTDNAYHQWGKVASKLQSATNGREQLVLNYSEIVNA